MQNLTRSILCALAVAAAVSSLPAATIDVVFVDRILVTQANAPACDDDLRFEHLNNQQQESLSLELTVDHTCDAATADAIARQQSSLGTQAIQATGACISNGQANVTSLVHSSAAQLFQVSIELDTPTPFTLVGSLGGTVQAQGPSNAVVAFVLSGPTGNILAREFMVEAGDDARAEPFSATGMLAPGSYSLFASLQTRLDSEAPPAMNVTTNFEYLFALTDCLGDLDADTQVGLGDLAILLANFGAQDAQFEDGDFDADADVDLADLSRMLSAFGTSCD